MPEWARAGRQPTPWEARGEHGFLKGFALTLQRSLFAPDAFWRTLRRDAGWGSALTYAWLINSFSFLLAMLLSIPDLRNLSAEIQSEPQVWGKLPAEAQQWIDWIATNAVAVALGLFLLYVIFYPLLFLLGAGMLHVGCLLAGAAKHGFAATARIVGYAQGPTLITWIPGLGGLIGLYTLVLEIWGLLRVQETTLGRAVVAAVVIPIMLAFLVAFLGALVAVVLAGALS